MALPTKAIHVHSFVLDLVLQRADVSPARRCPWSTDEGLEADIEPRERGSARRRSSRGNRPSFTTRWPRHGRACASVNATLDYAGSSRRGIREPACSRVGGALVPHGTCEREQPLASRCGALESCSESGDSKRAPHALGATQRGCREAQTRYIKIRLECTRQPCVQHHDRVRADQESPDIAQKP